MVTKKTNTKKTSFEVYIGKKDTKKGKIKKMDEPFSGKRI